MSGEASLSAAQQGALEQVMEDILNYTNRKNRKITDFFVDLPVPIPDFPEYWNEGSVVAHPRSLNVIRQLLAERVYSEPIQVYGDLKLVFLNGLLWLPKSTEAMRDAKTMEAAMEDVWTRYPETLPSLEQMGVTSSYDDDSSALNDRKNKARLTTKQFAEVDLFGKQTDPLVAPVLEQYKSGLQTTWVPSMSQAVRSNPTLPGPSATQEGDAGGPSASQGAESADTPGDVDAVDPSTSLMSLDVLAQASAAPTAVTGEAGHPIAAESLKRSASAMQDGAAGDHTQDGSTSSSESKMQRLEEVQVGAETVRIGDFALFKSPAVVERPIISQVFKISKDSQGVMHLHAIRFVRPEDTRHSVSRTFYHNEVVKASDDVVASLEDFQGRCLVLTPSQYQKGKPRVAYWAEHLPIYVCESVYNLDSKVFTPIQSWLDAQSEALRFDKIAMQQDEVPRRLAKLKSPFLRGVVGTGGIDASAPDVYAVNAVKAKSTKPTKSAAVGEGDNAWVAPRSLEDLAARDQFNVLPETISSRLRKDPATGDLLWFQSPPVSLPVTQPPLHTFDYLLWKARQNGSK